MSSPPFDAPPPLERRKVGEQIADTLRERILGGLLHAGDSLPSERELAQTYSVNRSSIREALRRLEALGLVDIRQGESTRVRDVLASLDLNLLPMLFEVRRTPDPDLHRELHEMRGMLLSWCAERAAEKADAASLARLEAIVDRMSAPGVRAKELQELDFQFFEMLVLVSGNRLLGLFTRLVREVYTRGRDRFVGMYAPGVLDIAHHRRALEAIRRRDAAAAGTAMRAHAATALATLRDGSARPTTPTDTPEAP